MVSLRTSLRASETKNGHRIYPLESSLSPRGLAKEGTKGGGRRGALDY